jgi:ADP-heptose:LPS heptosyltransferase
VEQYLEFGDYLELPSIPVSWNIALQQTHRYKLPQLLGNDDAGSIILNLGASKSENLWPEEYFIELLTLLRNSWKGKIVLAGGFEDRERAAKITAKNEVLDATGLLSLMELAALFSSADVVVGCDTGPLHLAVAMGTPVVGLYGPSDPQRTGPYGQANWVLVGSGGSECRSCRRWCGDPYTPCMRSIAPEMVFDKIEQRLAGHPSWIP